MSAHDLGSLARKRLLSGVLAVLLAGVSAAPALSAICDLHRFVEQCPTKDPAYAGIRNDFTIRDNGKVVGSIPCQEPISQMDVNAYSHALTIVQDLRVIYYLSAKLPWTPGTLYAWLKAKVQGFNIMPTGNSYCCSAPFGDRRSYIFVHFNDADKDYHRKPKGLIQSIGLLMHERRHADGILHVACCALGSNCDQRYDEAKLTPFGVQRWLDQRVVDGTVPTGYACAAPDKVEEFRKLLVQSANGFKSRFCENPPPDLPNDYGLKAMQCSCPN
jgi:hypothetical protein